MRLRILRPSSVAADSAPAGETPFPQEWRELYSAALFETRTDRLTLRIRDAERALAERARQLFAGNPKPAELKAMDACFRALDALRFCYGLRSDENESA